MNTNYSNTNFSSSYIPMKKIPVTKVLDSVSPYFEPQGFGNKSVNAIRKKINSSQVGIGIRKNEVVLVGKDRNADTLISLLLKKNNIESKFVQDTTKTKINSSAIDVII